MTRNEMTKILQQVYNLEVKMDEAIEKRDKAMSAGDDKKAEIAEGYHTHLSFQWIGMDSVIKALGYKLVDDDGFWKLERRA